MLLMARNKLSIIKNLFQSNKRLLLFAKEPLIIKKYYRQNGHQGQEIL